MKGLVTVGLLAGLLAFAAAKPAQAGVHVSVGVGLPGFGAVVTTGPGYYPYPADHYGPPRVYVEAPVYYPRARYRQHWYPRHHYRHVRREHRYHRHCDH